MKRFFLFIKVKGKALRGRRDNSEERKKASRKEKTTTWKG